MSRISKDAGTGKIWVIGVPAEKRYTPKTMRIFEREVAFEIDARELLEAAMKVIADKVTEGK